MPFIRQSFADKDAAEAACADWLSEKLSASLNASDGRTGFIVSGGSTPVRVLPALFRKNLDWSRIDTLASDERVLPVDHPDSTEGLVRRIFKENDQPLNYAGLLGETEPEAALEAWRKTRSGLASPPAVGFIGIGPDAHTASLFPGQDIALDEALDDAAVTDVPEIHKHNRLTLGLGLLKACPAYALVAADSGKIAALEQSMSDPENHPLGRLAKYSEIHIFEA